MRERQSVEEEQPRSLDSQWVTEVAPVVRQLGLVETRAPWPPKSAHSHRLVVLSLHQCQANPMKLEAPQCRGFSQEKPGVKQDMGLIDYMS